MALSAAPKSVFFHRERNLLPIVGIPLGFRHSGKSSSFQNMAIALLSKFNPKLSAANQLQRFLDYPTGILPISENLQRWAYSWQAASHASVKAAHSSGVSGFWRTRVRKLVLMRASDALIPDFTSCSSNNRWLLLL
jgi:hypothetical protein